MKRKLLSILVAFSLLLSGLPFSSLEASVAFAEGEALPGLVESIEGDSSLNNNTEEGVSGDGDLLESPPPPVILAAGEPVADVGEIAFGQQAVWRFTLEGAEHAAYRIESAGQSFAEGALPGDASEFTWTPDAAGEYTFIITAFRGAEQITRSSAVLVVVEAPLPEPLTAEILGGVHACAQGDTIAITAQAAGGIAPYQFSLSATFAGNVLASGEGALSFTAEQVGSYDIALFAKDASGATASATLVIQCTLSLPENISPDFIPTGDIAANMAAVARSQVGYMAGEGGFEGYTRYGDWYDRTYNGGIGAEGLLFGEWRATFISYCAAFAGVSDSVLPHSDTVAGWMDRISAFASPEDHAPAAGDIAFVSGGRVGVIAGVSADTITLVEGDVNGMVAESLCSVGEILGYVPIAGIVQPVEVEKEEEAEELPVNPEDLELLQVIFNEDSQPLPVVSVTPDSHLIELGQSALWTVGTFDGEGELSYQYSLLLNGEPFGEPSEAVPENTFAFTPDAVGTYVLLVSVMGEGLAIAAGESSPVNVSLGDLVNLAGDDWDAFPAVPTYEGGTIFSGTVLGNTVLSGPALAELEGLVPYFTTYSGTALLEELRVAYLECTSPLMTVGSPVTWTVRAEGGNGNYQYKLALCYQTFSNTTNIFQYVAIKDYSANPSFTYTPSQAGRYFLMAYIKDTANKVVNWQSQVFLTANASDVQTTTVAGKVKWIVQNYTNSGMDDTEKARALHNWLIANAEYDYRSSPYFHADGVLLYGKGVCQSYAQAYVLLCTEAGIPCLYVTGTAGGGPHGWNVVFIDGTWWHVDCTWDDPGGSSPRYTYFMKTDAQMWADHQWDDDPTDGYMDGIYPTSDTLSVRSVNLSESSLSIPIGGSSTVIATVIPADAIDTTLTWTSSKPLIASVNSMGVISAMSVGTAVVTAKASNGKYGSVAVTVFDPRIATGIKFVDLPTTWEITSEASLDLNDYIVITPDTARKDTTFAVTSGPTYAGVGTDGIVSPKKIGTSTFKATALSGNISVSASIRMVDSYAPTSIAIDQGTAKTVEMRDEPSLQLTATANPEGKRARTTWQSSASAVAAVDSDGLVTLKKSGVTTITATSQNGKVATLKLTVTDKYEPSGISFVDGNAMVLSLYDPDDAGKTPLEYMLETKLTPDTAIADLTWTSSAPLVASFIDGVLVTKKTGSTVVTVKTHNGKMATATVNIVDPKVPFGVTIGPDTLVKPVRLSLEDEPLELVATVAPATASDTPLTWTSSTQGIVSLEGGTVTPVKAGTTTITVKTGNGKTASLAVTVFDPNAVTAINFSQSPLKISMSSGDAPDLKDYVLITPSSATTELTFSLKSSLYNSYASVSKNGILTPKRIGTIYVNVTSSNGNKTATIQVQITR